MPGIICIRLISCDTQCIPSWSERNWCAQNDQGPHTRQACQTSLPPVWTTRQTWTFNATCKFIMMCSYLIIMNGWCGNCSSRSSEIHLNIMCYDLHCSSLKGFSSGFSHRLTEVWLKYLVFFFFPETDKCFCSHFSKKYNLKSIQNYFLLSLMMSNI